MKSLRVLCFVSLATIGAGCEEPDGPDVGLNDEDESLPEEGAIGETERATATGTLTLNDIYYVSATPGYNGASMYSTATTNTVLRRLWPGTAVKIVIAAPSNGRYRVDHAGVLGWIHGGDLTLIYRYNATLSETRIQALARARQAMGFSYWWSNARWAANGGATAWPVANRGSCTGNCPSCTHAATGGGPEYGADCSGFVSTIWGFPDFDPNTNPTNNGYVASTYYGNNPNWSTVTIRNALPGDAVVSQTHIYLLATPPNASGQVKTFECMGCAYGCKSMTRTPSPYSVTSHPIRRKGW